MTDHKATPEQWEQCKEWLNNPVVGATDSCMLELLSRIEALEKEQYEDHKTMNACFNALIDRIEKLEVNSKTTSIYIQSKCSL